MEINIDLINKCLAQDREAQKQLYIKLLPYLRAVALRYLRHKDLIKDVIQDSFLLIFKNLNQFDLAKGMFIKWAVRITINTTLNYNKRVKFDTEEIDLGKHDRGLSGSTLQDMSNKDFLTYLKKMPSSQFEVFNLSVVEGYDHEEIGKLLNISVVLSRKRLSRARAWIKERLKKSEDIEIKDIDLSKFF